MLSCKQSKVRKKCSFNFSLTVSSPHFSYWGSDVPSVSAAVNATAKAHADTSLCILLDRGLVWQTHTHLAHAVETKHKSPGNGLSFITAM